MGTEKLHEYVEALKSENENWVSEVVDALGEVTVITPRESISEVCSFLKDKQGFDMLADLCGCDRGPEEDPRFEVNYHVFSTEHYNRLRLKVALTEDDPKIDSVVGLWKTANWHERETYDLLGIIFENHPIFEGYCFLPTSMGTRLERTIL